MNTEPNPPQRPDGELLPQDEPTQQSPSPSPPFEAPSVQPFEASGADIYAPQRTPPPGSQGPYTPLPPPFGQQSPNQITPVPPLKKTSRGKAILLAGVVLLVIAASVGLFSVVRMNQIASSIANATVTARANSNATPVAAQATSIAEANALATQAQVVVNEDNATASAASDATASAASNATATAASNATATAAAPPIEDTSGAPCDKSFPAGTTPSTVIEQCPRAQYTIHLGASQGNNPPDVTVDNCTQSNEIGLPGQYFSSTGQTTTITAVDIRYFDCNGNSGTLVTVWSSICNNLSAREYPQKTTNATVPFSLQSLACGAFVR